MPRKRYSEGTLKKVGKRVKQWLGYWYVYEKSDTKEIRRKRKKILGPVAALDRGQAKEKLRQLIAESRAEIPPPPENPTISELWKRYKEHKSGAWSRVTATTLESLFQKSVLPVLGNACLEDVTLGPLQGILNRMAGAGKSQSSLQKARTHLKAMLEFAVDERSIETNPARGKKLVIPKKGVPKPTNRFLSMGECHALMRLASGRERLILRLFLVSGLRSQELFMLRVNDLEAGQIRVDEAFKRAEHGEDRIGDPKTEGSADVVAIPTDLERQLRSWVRSQNLAEADLLFPSVVGGPIDPSNYLERILRPMGVQAGVPDINFAMLRRTCATYFRDNLKGAQRQLRHKTPHVTAKHYQQSITAEHRSAVAKLDQELCNPAKKIAPIERRA
jgi:integrase